MPYDTLAAADIVARTAEALKARGVEALIVNDRVEALTKVKELISAGASVMNGSSRTLEEIGYIEYLKEGKHGWNNLHDGVLAEKDPAKQAELRRQSVLSDYYLGSVHAIAETGEMVVASASGSQVPHLAFTSQNLVLVASTQKIVPTLQDALKRVEEYVFPLEDQRMKSVGYPGSLLGKILIMAHEHPMMGRKVRVILVNEKLGF